MSYIIFKFIFWVLFKIIFRLKVIGKENLPKTGPYIIACNHTSLLDPPAVGVSVPMSVYYMGKKGIFRNKVAAWLLRSWHVFPVDQKRADLASIKKAMKVLDDGNGLIVFPEGTRSRDGEIGEVTNGVGFFAAKSNASIIPAFIKGSFEAWRPGARFLKPKQVVLRFGVPIDPKDYMSGNKGDYDRITDEVMNRIRSLSEM